MANERQGILALLADGKISAIEAERLLRAWDAGFDWLWFAAACFVICLASQIGRLPFRELAHLADGIRIGANAVLHHLANLY